jgi:hypothetical protein
LALSLVSNLYPGELRLGEIVVTGEVECLEGTFERGAAMTLRTDYRAEHLELLLAESNDPHETTN